MLGFQTGYCAVTVNIQDGHRGESEITLPTPLRSVADTISYFERRVQVLYAGALAESLRDNTIDNKQAITNIREGGASDHGKAKELIHIIRDLLHPDTTAEDTQPELDSIDLRLWNAAAKVVFAEKACIEKLAFKLVAKVEQYDQRAELSRTDIVGIRELQKLFP